MLYAVNLDKINKKVLSGVQWRPNTLIPPISKSITTTKQPGSRMTWPKPRSY